MTVDTERHKNASRRAVYPGEKAPSRSVLCDELWSYLNEVFVVVELEAALEQSKLEITRRGQQTARAPLHQRR